MSREQERLRQEEQERIRREERAKLEAEQRAIEAERRAQEEKEAAIESAREEAAQEVIDGLIPDMDGETSLYEYRISLSEDAKKKLEMYMDSVGIEWELMQ